MFVKEETDGKKANGGTGNQITNFERNYSANSGGTIKNIFEFTELRAKLAKLREKSAKAQKLEVEKQKILTNN